MDMEDAHPLRREALIDDIWPCLKICRICLGKRKPDFRASLKLCMHLDMDLKTTEVNRSPEFERDETTKEKDEENKEDLNIQKEPFLQLGYGVNAHLDILL